MSSMYTTGWIPIRFTNTTPIEALRDNLYSVIGKPDLYHLEEDPHISMFGFDMTTRRFDSFQNDFNTIASDLIATTFSINDYHVYPSIDNPMVVSLEPNLNIDSACSDAIEALEQHDGNVRWGPHPPHITLFKGGNAGLEDDWGELPEPAHDRLRHELNVTTPSFELTIDTISLEI